MSYNTILATAPLTTQNYHLKMIGTSIGNSLIWDNGTNVGIGNTNTSYTLDVSGTGRFTSTLLVSGAATFSGFVGINGSPATAFPLEAYINSSTAYSSTSRGNVMRVYNSNTSANIFAGIELGGAGTANDGLAGLNAVVTGSGSAALTFYTRDSNTFAERMRITSAGNVGIGTSSPTNASLHIANPTASETIRNQDNAAYISFYNAAGTTRTGYIQYNATSASAFVLDIAQAFTFNTSGIERMRITSGGNVGIGTNNPTEILHLYTSAGPELRMESSAVSWYIRAYNDNFNVLTPTGRQAVSFLNNGDVRNYNNTTTWQQTSDARVKENINTISDAMDKILSLNPVIFDYKQEFADKNNWDDNKKINNVGFIAQEFETIFPKYISTNKYEMTETIIDDLKSIDTGHLVTYLVKAVQEQQIQIQNLQEQINILAK